jgi:hypothetical protein
LWIGLIEVLSPRDPGSLAVPFEVRNVIAPADDASAPEIEITNAIPTVIPENLFDDGEDSNGEGVRRERLDDAGKNLRGNESNRAGVVRVMKSWQILLDMEFPTTVALPPAVVRLNWGLVSLTSFSND